MKWIALSLAAAVATVVAIWDVEYGFYNPPHGVAQAGRAETAKDPHERELLRLTVTAADVERFGGQATLRKLSDLYGTSDSIPCSVRRTFDNDNTAAADWPLRAETGVMLCLN